jgi:hypothetical protein
MSYIPNTMQNHDKIIDSISMQSYVHLRNAVYMALYRPDEFGLTNIEQFKILMFGWLGETGINEEHIDLEIASHSNMLYVLRVCFKNNEGKMLFKLSIPDHLKGHI